jgi:serine protease Do
MIHRIQLGVKFMSAPKTLSRKLVYGLAALGLMGATALTTTLAVPPPTLVQAQTQSATPIDPSKGVADLVDRVMPAVISVEVKYAAAASNNDEDGEATPNFRDFFNQFPQFRDQLPPGFQFRNPPRNRDRGSAVGSGFIISGDGYAVTNNHVVKDANEVNVKLTGGTEYRAKVIGTDPKTDLALIKIEGDKPFQYVSFARGESRVGDWVMAVGNPFGLSGTVTTGIVSARGRDIGTSAYDDFLQIDASINKGNSGGPAFNLNGEVIGVNTAIYSPSGGSVGIGFAIPASTTLDVIKSLRENGSVTRGWLGVQIQPVTRELADGLGLADAKGAIISDITENSPAETAGFKAGDTILKADGQDIADSRDMAKKVARIAPGKDVSFEIIRNGKPMTVTAKLAKMPTDQQAMAPKASKAEPSSMTDLGLRLGPADDGAGVKILEVDPDGIAAKEGLKAGDVIMEVAGKEVSAPDDVKSALSQVDRPRVMMLVRSGEGNRILTLPLKKG